MALIESTTIVNHDVEVHAFPTGRWSVVLDGKEIGSGDTMEKAKGAARAKLAKQRVKVNVPFITRNGEYGFAYALHAKSNKPMVELGGEKMEWSGYHDVLRADMPEDELDRYIALKDTIKDAEKQANEIEKAYAFSLATVVRVAVDKAVTESAA